MLTMGFSNRVQSLQERPCDVYDTLTFKVYIVGPTLEPCNWPVLVYT